MLLLLLAGCPPEKEDSGDTADTADTADSGVDTGGCVDVGDSGIDRAEGPVTFSDADDTCDRRWDEADAGGCGWGYVYLEDSARLVEIDLELPPADLETDNDWIYTLPVGAGARVDVLERDGGADEMDFWSCSDYTQSFTGTLWTGVGGHVQVESRWVCDTTDPYCKDDEVEAHAVVRLDGVWLESVAGVCESLDDAEYRVLFGVTECGG